MAKVDFKENGSKGVESSKNNAQGAKGKAQSHFFEDVSIRPLDRLAHLIHEQSDSFSDHDLGGFITALESEVHQVRELVSALGGIIETSPCLDYGQEIDALDLRLNYQKVQEALNVAINALSNFSDSALVSAYASGAITSRLLMLKGGAYE